MLIAGAGGFALEVLEVLLQSTPDLGVVFFDNTEAGRDVQLIDRYRVLHTEEEVKDYFKENDKQFTLGTGNPKVREYFWNYLTALGGEGTSAISPYAQIGKIGTHLGSACSVMTGTVVTSMIHIETGVLLNLNCTVGHNAQIGAFSEICPGVRISGDVHIGKSVFIGTGAVILPGVRIGDHAKIAAGAVVTQDVPNGALAVGVPAVLKDRKGS